MIQRFVAKRKCPKDCKDDLHKNEFVIYYHIPFVGVISADGPTEDEADKFAKIKASEAIAQFYSTSLKRTMEIEELLIFK